MNKDKELIQVGFMYMGELHKLSDYKDEEPKSKILPLFIRSFDEHPPYIPKGCKIDYVKYDTGSTEEGEYECRQGVIETVICSSGKFRYFVTGGDFVEWVNPFEIAKVDGKFFEKDDTDSIVGDYENVFHIAALMAYGHPVKDEKYKLEGPFSIAWIASKISEKLYK